VPPIRIEHTPFILLKYTLQHIQKSYEVIAASQALLEQMKEIEERRIDQVGQ